MSKPLNPKTAVILRALALPIRLQVVYFLQQEDTPQTVTTIYRRLNILQPICSQALIDLYQAGIVVRHKEKTNVLYALHKSPALRKLLKEIFALNEQLPVVDKWGV
jgi:DNA-binding transcriptional ArsR family regulator